jgi:hypothetical protein
MAVVGSSVAVGVGVMEGTGVMLAVGVTGKGVLVAVAAGVGLGKIAQAESKQAATKRETIPDFRILFSIP